MPSSRTTLLCLLALLAATTHSQCTDGCLLCERIDANSSKCSICDSFASYVPFGVGLCFKLEIENCLIPTTNRSVTKCLACKDGTIYDTTTHKCKEVAKPIENCVRYDNQAACSLCAKDYYINGATCDKVAVPVENCGYYFTDGASCLSCSTDYFKNPFDAKCVAITSSENCLAYSQWDCLQCSAGYVINQNFGLIQTMTTNTLQTFVSSYVAKTVNSSLVVANTPVENCQKGVVVNCAVHQTFDTCKTCNSGFMITEDAKSCLRFPEEPILNCQIYSTATSCLKCINGTHRDVNSNCVPSTIVANCFVYSQTLDQCDQCEYGFYKNASACIKRVNSLNVIQCKTYHPTLDECQECNPNFLLLSSSKVHCLTGFVNCQTYSVTGPTNFVACTLCNTGYGLQDGECHGLSTEHCLTYDGNTNECQECNTDYYVDFNTKKCFKNTSNYCSVKHKNENKCVTCNTDFWANDGHCHIQYILNCITYAVNINECTTCMIGNFLNTGNNNICTLSTAKHCTTPNSSLDICDTCNLGYYPDDAQADKCVPQSKPGCDTYTDNTNTCTLCHTDHFPDPTSDVLCSPQAGSINQCNEYVPLLKQCNTCNDGWYKDASDECTAYADANCATQTPNTNECTTCNNLFYLDGAKLCTTIGDSGCKTSNGAATTAFCIECLKTHFKAGGTTCTIRSVPINPDPICIGNTSDQNNGSCTVCPANQMAFYADIHDSSSITATANCQEIDASSGACTLCAPGWGSTSSSVLCLNPSIVDNCLQKTTAGVAELLSLAGNCAVCREPDKMYLKSDGGGTCTSRFMIDRMNCSKGSSTFSACEICDAGSHNHDISQLVTCAPKDPAFTVAPTTSLCDVWFGDFYSCRACKSMSGNNCTNSLTTTRGIVQNYFDKDFNLTTWGEGNSNVATGCKDSISFSPVVFMDGTDALIGCNECATTHLKNTSKYFGSQQYTLASYAKGALHPFPDIIISVNPCADKSAIPGNYNGFAQDVTAGPTPVDFSINFADISDIIITPHGIITSRCYKGKFPVRANIEYSTGGTTLLDDDTKRGLYSTMVTVCNDPPAGFTLPIKRYSGLEAKFYSMVGLHLAALLHYDSCVLATDLFVFVGQQDATSKAIYFSLIPSGQTNELCIKPSIADGTAHTIINNCQVHFYEGNDNDFTVAKTLKCLACKPGFAPTFVADNVNKVINTCTLITNCDTSNEANNTWMNSCQKCMDGHTWELDPNSFLPNFSICATEPSTNCQFKNTDSNSCIFCKPGYLTEPDTTCSKWEISNCKTLGMPPIVNTISNLSLTIGSFQSYAQMAAFFNYQYIGDAKKDKLFLKSGCLECDADFYRTTMDSNPYKVCTGTTSTLYTSVTSIANCVKFAVNAAQKCAECKEGFAFNDVSDLCEIEVTATENCLTKNAGGCVTCRSGQPPQSNLCPLYENCAQVDPTSFKCARCEAYHKPKTGTEDYDCEPRGSNDICKYYDHSNICLQCDDTTKSPITFVNSLGKGIRTKCVDDYHDLTGSNNKDALAANTSYIIKADESTFRTKFKTYKVLNLDKNFDVTSPYRPAFYGSTCINAPIAPNCKTYTDTYSCSVCNPGFILDTANGDCKEGTVGNCAEYDASEFCTKCQIDFYLVGTGAPAKCEPRFKKNCKTYSDTDDQCTACLDNAFYTSAGGLCTNYTVSDCQAYNTTLNECTACDTGDRYLDATDGNKCKLYSKQFCNAWDAAKDECTGCNLNRYLSATTKECEAYTVTNCKGANVTSADECSDCQNFFYLVSGKCEAATTTNCFQLHATIDKCVTCKKNYFLNGSEKCDPNTAANCNGKKLDLNECVACLAVHYRHTDQTCKPHAARNCSTYSATTDECDSCLNNFYLNTAGATKVCDPNGSAFCHVKNTLANDCVTCIERYYLNSSNQCQSITNTTCLTMTVNKNQCATCSKNKYVDQADKQCKPTTSITNCALYSLTDDICSLCKTGFYRSPDNKSCFVNPNGILHCARYTNLTTCEACNNTHYLSENRCTLFDPATETIVNCLEYIGVKICSKCTTGFIALDNICLAHVATGCLTWTDKDTCETCPIDKVLSDTTPKHCESTTILGCVHVTGTKGSETCVQCNSTTFLKDNKCESVSVAVTECLRYTSNGICAQCPDAKALSADGKTCVIIDAATLGPHCTLGTYGAAPKCSLCDKGYLMDSEGLCTTQCQAENCLVCNPMDTKQCNLCQTDHHMTSEMACINNNQAVVTTSARRASWAVSGMLVSLIALFVNRNILG